jgi:IPT/TIG domain
LGGASVRPINLLLLAGLLVSLAGGALSPAKPVLAAISSPFAPASHNVTLPGRLVNLKALPASPTTSHSNSPIPFLPRDQATFAAAQQLANQGKTGRRSGVAALPRSNAQASTSAPLTAQQLAAFPVMDLSRQVTSFGADQNVSPPDTQLGAGPANLVEATNSSLSIWTKAGAFVSSVDLNVMLSAPTGFHIYDPRILYDTESGRWFLSALGASDTSNDSLVYIAASTTSDPAAAWYIGGRGMPGVLGDQPMTGVSTDKVVISWNDFTGPTPATTVFSGQETWVLQKSDLTSSLPIHATAFGPETSRFRIVPSQSLTPSATEWLTWNTFGPAIGVIAITGTPAAGNVGWTEHDLAMQATSVPPSPRQPSGVAVTAAIDDRFLSATWQGGMLWVSGTDGCTPTGDFTSRDCMKFVGISTSGIAPTVLRDFDGSENGIDIYYPAVSLDSSGDLVISYSASSPTLFPSAFAVDSLAKSPATLENQITLASGLASYQGGTTSRWGDYSASAPDPTNPADVWVTAEYQASATTLSNWGTSTGRLAIRPSMTAVSPNVGAIAGGTSVTITGSHFQSGAAVSFGANAATSVVVVNGEQITATTPAGAAGAVDVAVTNVDGSTGTLVAAYTYTTSVVVSSVAPNSGSLGGRTSVTITGANFTGATAVTFGVTAATSFAIVSDSQVTAVSPARAGGLVDVTVTTPAGTSATAPADQFTYTLLTWYFPWYDLQSPGMRADTIHITNESGSTANGTIAIPAATTIPFSVLNGENRYFSFTAGTIGGPVTLTSDQPVLATLRAWYYQSFNETPARPASAAATVQYFPWYDLQSSGMRADTIHITNVSGSPATGTIALPGATSLTFTVNPGRDNYFSFPSGTIGGPVTLTSSQPVLASLRAWYYQSFNEVQGRAATAAAMTQYFPWYDVASAGVNADTIHLTNESGALATGTIALGTNTLNFSLGTGLDGYFAFPGGTIGGPVTITSDQPVLASLRAWYYQSFNEIQGRSAAAAAKLQYFPWYDIASPGVRADTIHITNESGIMATGTIALGTQTIPFTVNTGTDQYYAFPGGTIGGPVTITSDQPVLASLRAWYYQSFNEVPGYR